MKHLNVLSNMEKHKIIIPTGMWPETGEIGFWFSDFDDKVIDSKKQYRIGSQIRVGTNIFTVVIASEDPKVQARTHFKVYPVFPRTIVKPPSGQPAIPAQEVTDNISKVYTEMLNQAAKFF